MAVTTNTLLPLMAVGDVGKETKFSDAMSILDDLTAGYLAKSVAGAVDVTLTEAEARSLSFEYTGVLTASINVIVPSREKALMLVFNNTTGAFALTVKTAAGTGVAVTQGDKAILSCDGTNVLPGVGGSAGLLTGLTANKILYATGANTAATDTAPHWDATNNRLGLGSATPEGALHITADGFQAGEYIESYFTAAGGPAVNQRHARGSLASPTYLVASDGIGGINFWAWTRDAADALDEWTRLVRLRGVVGTVDAQSRMGGQFEIYLSPGVSASDVLKLRLTEVGNLLIGGATVPGTGATNTIVLTNGTAPGTSPADRLQLWSADQEGTAGQSALHILDETGVTTSIGKGLLTRRVVEASTAGSGAPNVLVAGESHKMLTNEGSAARNYHTLPTAVAGLVFTFVCQDADGMRVTAAAGDTIRVAAGVTAAAGYIENGAIGDMITLAAINATEWWDMGSRGVWTPT